MSASDRAILIWSGRGGGGGARLAELAHRLGLDGKPGCAAFHLPATPNGRGVTEAWAAAADGDEENPEPIGLLIVSGDEAASDPAVRALAEQAEHVLAITMFHGLVRRLGRPRPAGDALPRARRHVLQPRGPGAAAAPHGDPARARRARLDREARRALRRRALAPRLAVFAELSEQLYGGMSFGDVGERASLPDRASYTAPTPAPEPPIPPVEAPPGEHFLGTLSSAATGRSSPAPAVERVPELQFQRPEAVIELAADDAERRQIVERRDRQRPLERHCSFCCAPRINRALAAGTVRIAEEHAGDLHRDVEVVKP